MRPFAPCAVSEEFSSSGDSKTEEDPEKRSPRERDSKERDKDRDRDEGQAVSPTPRRLNHTQPISLLAEIVRIFDGNSSERRRIYRAAAVPRNAPAQVLLVQTLTS